MIYAVSAFAIREVAMVAMDIARASPHSYLVRADKSAVNKGAADSN